MIRKEEIMLIILVVQVELVKRKVVVLKNDVVIDAIPVIALSIQLGEQSETLPTIKYAFFNFADVLTSDVIIFECLFHRNWFHYRTPSEELVGTNGGIDELLSKR